MTYRIEIKRSARKALLALSHDMRRRLGAAIDALAPDPGGPGARKLSGSDLLSFFGRTPRFSSMIAMLSRSTWGREHFPLVGEERSMSLEY